MAGLPQDLIDYLLDLVSPPGERAVYCSSLEDFDTNWWRPSSVCGLVVRGKPTEAQSAELMRILRPGAHLLLVAPEDQPTGHTGACRLEDAGFEIRDAILWIREPGRFHYVAKAARSERELGCERLEGKTGAAAVDRTAGSAGTRSPRAGAGRTADKVKNHHPTCKPVMIMKRLLGDVPKDKGPVLDPFMGSGTTGIACVGTGHDFVGIDREAEYLEIADARIRFWDNSDRYWIGRGITSDQKPREEKTLTLDEMLGLGDK